MRFDKNNPRQGYEDFWDWLQVHPIWLLNVVFGYAFYLATTEEVG